MEDRRACPIRPPNGAAERRGGRDLAAATAGDHPAPAPAPHAGSGRHPLRRRPGAPRRGTAPFRREGVRLLSSPLHGEVDRTRQRPRRRGRRRAVQSAHPIGSRRVAPSTTSWSPSPCNGEEKTRPTCRYLSAAPGLADWLRLELGRSSPCCDSAPSLRPGWRYPPARPALRNPCAQQKPPPANDAGPPNSRAAAPRSTALCGSGPPRQPPPRPPGRTVSAPRRWNAPGRAATPSQTSSREAFGLLPPRLEEGKSRQRLRRMSAEGGDAVIDGAVHQTACLNGVTLAAKSDSRLCCKIAFGRPHGPAI